MNFEHDTQSQSFYFNNPKVLLKSFLSKTLTQSENLQN
jgi:hypothetical protein